MTEKGNGSATGLPPRAERMTVGVAVVVSCMVVAFLAGSKWTHMLDVNEAQQATIEEDHAAIEEIRASLKDINANVMAVREHEIAATDDRWRGKDMHEWGREAEKLNEGFSAPDIEALPGYAKRNEADAPLRQ